MEENNKNFKEINSKLEKIDNYMKQLNFTDLLVLIGNQQVQINNMIQVINLQSQLFNEFKIDLNKILIKFSDIEIRNNIGEEVMYDILSNITQLYNDNQEIKNSIDNIKIYNLPDSYFK